LLALGARAQDRVAKAGEPAEEPLFRSGVASVRVDALVLQDDQLVTDLTKIDFIVFDEGQQQPIVYFGQEKEPLSLVLLLDVSGSMTKYVEQVGEVARESLRYLRVGDKVAVMVFARNAKVRKDFTEHMWAVADEIRAAVWDESLGSGTNINDALLAAAGYLDRQAGDTGRKAVLILTDNLGLNYRSPDEPVINALFAADAVMNAIVVGKGKRPEPSPGRYTNPDFTPPNVFRIAEETGGEAVKANEAGKAFSNMIERIRTRYALHFDKPADAKGFRRIRVELTPAAKLRYPRAVLRARKGYNASK
jgi:VWFA-related protein